MLIQLRAASPYSVKEYDRKLMGFCGFAEDFTDFSDFFMLWKEIRSQTSSQPVGAFTFKLC